MEGTTAAAAHVVEGLQHKLGMGFSGVTMRNVFTWSFEWHQILTQVCGLQEKMFATLAMTMLDDVNTINSWAEPHNANGVTPNTVIDSNDEPAGNNQQRMTIRAY